MKNIPCVARQISASIPMCNGISFPIDNFSEFPSYLFRYPPRFLGWSTPPATIHHAYAHHRPTCTPNVYSQSHNNLRISNHMPQRSVKQWTMPHGIIARTSHNKRCISLSRKRTWREPHFLSHSPLGNFSETHTIQFTYPLSSHAHALMYLYYMYK